ncbi:hypothetical protein E2C01_014790 [Portunus trituberculatus]|uniref:Uncharacterized protein n=1 Tax=Portunus trituberculatus TaxID=210409 RepID=A0A5B7DKY1_PORTR|nr:hypothetical protein [Portunus trituberculatus]
MRYEVSGLDHRIDLALLYEFMPHALETSVVLGPAFADLGLQVKTLSAKASASEAENLAKRLTTAASRPR